VTAWLHEARARDLGDLPKERRLARERDFAVSGALEVPPPIRVREAVLLTAASCTPPATRRLDDEEARQLEAHLRTHQELGRYRARELRDAVKA